MPCVSADGLIKSAKRKLCHTVMLVRSYRIGVGLSGVTVIIFILIAKNTPTSKRSESGR